ncbi:HPt (histidine-containing phosphotransfer) domain-containing protein [Arthrobacter pascens]|uniref:Hpt domain-containing protein n=1 Tax=Arthrobacter pascens TaxID=1677 RepID=UPI0027921A5E|nr:Hpt domain-containing protein [Arthrobacter pascens]MDQ0677549.1 HPt (histidine-containing phosphotransfer) domain-containing protein [Arthrobacter pascens]
MNIPQPGTSDGGVPADTSSAGSRLGADAGISPDVEELLPLVDASILEDLEDQLNGSELAVRFARDYAAMWDQRCARLAAAVQSEDGAAALDAIISLKITSAMVGGVRLARLAEILEKVIRQGDFGRGQELMERVAHNGDRTVSELQDNYILKNG